MLALRIGRCGAALPRAALHTSAVASAKKKRSRQAVAFEKAKKFAAALQETATPIAGPSTPVPPAWPEPEAPPAQTLTLDDLLKLKPRSTPNPVKGNYADKHEALFGKVDHAFVRGQLYALASEMGLSPRSKAGKATIIQLILDSWGWVRPQPQEKPGTWTRHITVSTSELFLLQRDERVAEWLAALPGVVITIEPEENNGGEPRNWLLVATGRKEDLLALDTFLAKERDSHIVLRWPADIMRGFVPTRATLWAISIATGAHVTTQGWTKYVVAGKSLASAAAAKRMLLTIATRATAKFSQLGVCQPAEDAPRETLPLYALTPHVPSSSSPLPWDTYAAAGGRALFRLVNTEVDNPGLRQARHRAAKLEGAPVMAVGGGEDASLRAVVERTAAAVKASEGADRTITFKMGHLLTSAGVDAGLDAPIPGAWPIEPTSPWAKLSTPIFSPVLPPALVHFPLPSPKRIRRVTYVAETGARVSAEYIYPSPVDDTPAPTAKDEPAWVHRLDQMIAQQSAPEHINGEMVFDFGALRGLIEEEKPRPEHPRQVSARHVASAVEDVLLPDRPTDVRIVARAVEEVDDLPELEEFFDAIHEHAHEAAEIPLNDMKGLRRGRAEVKVAEKVDAEVADEGEEWDEYEKWDEEDGGEVRFEQEEAMESEPKPSQPEEALSSTEVAQPEGEVGQPAPEVALSILPPASVMFRDVSYFLEQDAVIEVSESAAPSAEDEVTDQPVLRTLAVADLTGTGGVARYAELEGRVNDTLWRELASATREVPPTSLGRGVRM